MLQEHKKEALVAVNNEMPEILERDAFNLLMKQVKNDIDVYAVWRHTYGKHDSAICQKKKRFAS